MSSGYSIALFIHLLSFMLASAVTGLSVFAAFRLRLAADIDEATDWTLTVARAARWYSPATLGLLASGAYMTAEAWAWSTPWIVAALVGLVLIVALGAGIEGGRGRALRRELATAGLSARARVLLCDPLSWSARTGGVMLMLAVVFVMTVKPGAVDSAAALVVGAAVGFAAGIPLWRAPALTIAEGVAPTT